MCICVLALSRMVNCQVIHANCVYWLRETIIIGQTWPQLIFFPLCNEYLTCQRVQLLLCLCIVKKVLAPLTTFQEQQTPTHSGLSWCFPSWLAVDSCVLCVKYSEDVNIGICLIVFLFPPERGSSWCGCGRLMFPVRCCVFDVTTATTSAHF